MLSLPAEITHNQASACAIALSSAIYSAIDKNVLGQQRLVLDASQLIKFDSSALAVMLHGRREALALGRAFAVQGLTPRLQALAAMYGVTELLCLH